MAGEFLTKEEKQKVKDTTLNAIMLRIDDVADSIRLYKEGIARDQLQLDQHQAEMDALTMAAQMLGWKAMDNTAPTSPEERPKEPGFCRLKHKREKGAGERVKADILKELANFKKIILKDAAKKFHTSNGTAWRQCKIIVEEQPEKYEWYQDFDREYNVRGIREIQ